MVYDQAEMEELFAVKRGMEATSDSGDNFSLGPRRLSTIACCQVTCHMPSELSS